MTKKTEIFEDRYAFESADERLAPRLKEMAARVIRENYTPFLGDEAVEAFLKSGQSDQEIDDGLKNCTVMTTAGTPVAFAIACGNRLHLLMVDVEYQRKGCGTALLRVVEGRLFDQYAVAELQSFKENARANDFYRQNGWTVVGSEKLEGTDIEVLRFEKRKAPLRAC